MLFPAKELFKSLAARIGSDPDFLGALTRPKVAPILAPYVPSTALEIGSLVLDPSGSLKPRVANATTVVGINPLTGSFVIVIRPIAAGWVWSYDSASPAPPATVYGFAVVNTAVDTLLGVQRPLATPIVMPANAYADAYYLTLEKVEFEISGNFFA